MCDTESMFEKQCAGIQGDQPMNTTLTALQPTLAEKMQQELDAAQKEVARLTELVTLLNRNPEVYRILELIGQNRRY